MPADTEKMPKVFKEFGFTDLDISKEDFLNPDFVIEVGREPLKIQVITGIDGVDFDECYKNRFVFKEGDLEVPFIGYEQLVKNKAASPRLKDKLDLEELKRARKPQQGDSRC